MRSTSSKMGTVALVVAHRTSVGTMGSAGSGLAGESETELVAELVEYLSDEGEIALLQAAVESGEKDPLAMIYSRRERQAKEDEDFGDYVEELLSQPCVRPEIQHHGIQWLKSKMRIETFQKSEKEATSVIAQYAFKLYREQPNRTDFILAGPHAQVRIRIFELRSEAQAA